MLTKDEWLVELNRLTEDEVRLMDALITIAKSDSGLLSGTKNDGVDGLLDVFRKLRKHLSHYLD